MSADLIKRLRKIGGNGFLIGHEAADELERLTRNAKPVAWMALKDETGATRNVVSIGAKPPPLWPEAIPLYAASPNDDFLLEAREAMSKRLDDARELLREARGYLVTMADYSELPVMRPDAIKRIDAYLAQDKQI